MPEESPHQLATRLYGESLAAIVEELQALQSFAEQFRPADGWQRLKSAEEILQTELESHTDH